MWLSLEVYRNADHFCTFIKTLIFFYDKMPTICDLLIFFVLNMGVEKIAISYNDIWHIIFFGWATK